MENKIDISFMDLCFMLAAVFAALKLTGMISWSWWAVLSPILIPMGLYLGLFFVALVAICIKGTNER